MDQKFCLLNLKLLNQDLKNRAFTVFCWIHLSVLVVFWWNLRVLYIQCHITCKLWVLLLPFQFKCLLFLLHVWLLWLRLPVQCWIRMGQVDLLWGPGEHQSGSWVSGWMDPAPKPHNSSDTPKAAQVSTAWPRQPTPQQSTSSAGLCYRESRVWGYCIPLGIQSVRLLLQGRECSPQERRHLV